MEQPDTPTASAAAAGRGTRPGRSGTITFLEVVLWVITVQVALQPIFAGMLLEGSSTGRMLHLVNGSLVELTALFLLVAAILAWRPGRAPGRVAVAGILAFVVLYTQATVGHVGALQVHVPLGVASLLLMLWLLATVRRLQPATRREQEKPRPEPPMP